MFDKRRGQPSPKRVPFATVEKVLARYGEKYFDFNGRHFHEKLRAQHEIALSYSWVKTVLQGAGPPCEGRFCELSPVLRCCCRPDCCRRYCWPACSPPCFGSFWRLFGSSLNLRKTSPGYYAPYRSHI
jgi:hypothetical protein